MSRHLSAVAPLNPARTEVAVMADLLEDVRRAYADLPESESKSLVAALLSLTRRALAASKRRARRGGENGRMIQP